MVGYGCQTTARMVATVLLSYRLKHRRRSSRRRTAWWNGACTWRRSRGSLRRCGTHRYRKQPSRKACESPRRTGRRQW
ncbi:hypothetical protein PFISCL1PPCAC_4719 [Pristionchus fissidentatus]|uniref:Secreted protein n=1 Tax=Pristionchus fissidentatus TaxID=1538716 RepID=A0AAV5V558_9BILA|nr:hypothetical protein PFISCL1PPCAC_4719 [Pristionchus fissidentatus]